MKKALILILLAGLAFAETNLQSSNGQGVKHYIFQDAEYYPPDKINIENIITDGLFNGKEESESLLETRRKFFFLIPRLRVPLKKYQEGAFRVSKDLDRQIITVYQPELEMKIVLSYTNAGDSSRIHSKQVLLDDQEIDIIRYYFKDDKVQYITSRNHGVWCFSKPDGILDRLNRWYKRAEFFLFE